MRGKGAVGHEQCSGEAATMQQLAAGGHYLLMPLFARRHTAVVVAAP
jgi:hypothetical protein